MESTIVFSHLRWDFVFQRPQQRMSRLARYYAIVFVAELQPGGLELEWHQSSPQSRLTVLRPEMNIDSPGVHSVDPTPWREKLRELRGQYRNAITWLIRRMREKLFHTSWDSTAAAMHQLLRGLPTSPCELASPPWA